MGTHCMKNISVRRVYEATNRMIEEAKNLGADAIVGIRYGSSEAVQGAAEMLAYGTAVKLK